MHAIGATGGRVSFPVSLFTFGGRIGRLAYGLGIVVALSQLVAVFALAARDPSGRDLLNFGAGPMGLFWWLLVASVVQRLHDAGVSLRVAIGVIIASFASLTLAVCTAQAWLFAVFAAILATPALLLSRTARQRRNTN